MTADNTALQQAAADLEKALAAGDVEAAEQAGQPEYSVNTVPEKEPERKEAATNAEQKAKRISDAEWQETKELASKVKEMAPVLDRMKEALKDAPAEVQKEVDPVVQVQKLTELLERKDWEAEHPVVKKEKYEVPWKKVNSDPRFSGLTYDERWRLIKDEPPSRLQEELKSQKDFGSIPPASRGGSTTGSNVDSMAAEFLEKAGFKKAANKLKGL